MVSYLTYEVACFATVTRPDVRSFRDAQKCHAEHRHGPDALYHLAQALTQDPTPGQPGPDGSLTREMAAASG